MIEMKSELSTLFADVVDSVAIYDQLGDDAGHAVIVRCIDEFRSVTERHQGTFIKSNGDDIMCTFPEPRLALEAAQAMQVATEQLATEFSSPLAIRAGFHHGTVLLEADGDVRGDAVNVAARLSNYAKTGQIVTSQQTIELVPDAKYRTLERVRLKGKSEPVSICEVIWKEDVMMTIFASAVRNVDSQPNCLDVSLGDQACSVSETNFKITIGRDPSSDIRVAGKRASRHHATIEFIRGTFMLIDCSTNATYIRQDAGDTRLHRERTPVIGSGQLSLGIPFTKEPIEIIELVPGHGENNPEAD